MTQQALPEIAVALDAVVAYGGRADTGPYDRYLERGFSALFERDFDPSYAIRYIGHATAVHIRAIVDAQDFRHALARGSEKADALLYYVAAEAGMSVAGLVRAVVPSDATSEHTAGAGARRGYRGVEVHHGRDPHTGGLVLPPLPGTGAAVPLS